MARVRGEYIRLGSGPSTGGGGWPNVLEARPINNFSIAVTGVATTVVAGPIVPAFVTDGIRAASQRGHVRLIADADMVVEVCDPQDADFATAVATVADPRSFYIQAGIQEVIPVKTGQRLSFITAAL